MGQKAVPKGAFVEAFRIVCWKVLVLHQRVAELSVVYDGCPSYCGLSHKRLETFCDGCPLVREDKDFRREALAELKKSLGESWKEWGFDSLQRQVHDVAELSNKDEAGKIKLTVFASSLVSIYRQEKNKLRRARQDKADSEWKDWLKKNGRK